LVAMAVELLGQPSQKWSEERMQLYDYMVSKRSDSRCAQCGRRHQAWQTGCVSSQISADVCIGGSCANCGNTIFAAYPGQAVRNKYCGKECANSHLAKKRQAQVKSGVRARYSRANPRSRAHLSGIAKESIFRSQQHKSRIAAMDLLIAEVRRDRGSSGGES
jgi:hypothetical protein